MTSKTAKILISDIIPATMRFLYSLLSCVFLPLALLKLAKNHNLRRAGERFGFIKPIKNPVVWVHCVSMGEFLSAKVLIDSLLKNHQILLTSTTKTGSDAIIKYYQNQVFHLYFPFDCPFIIKRYLSKINVKMLILLETEIWANLIYQLHQKNTPALLVNARLSHRSQQKYQKFAAKLTKKTLNKLSLIATQNQNSAERFMQLGAKKSQITVSGNLKFDQVFAPNPAKIKIPSKAKKPILLFASTHEGEERKILESYLKIRDKLEVFLLIVPRHPQRFEQVFELIKSYNLQVCKRSKPSPDSGFEVMLGDSIGELMSYFQLADIVFMGGSFSNTGGHNMLEPAALAKPILFGKSVFNFTEISQDLIAQNAAIQVANADDLFAQIQLLLNTPKTAKTLGKNAQKYLHSNQGTTQLLINEIAFFE